jgi:hypothetical protein
MLVLNTYFYNNKKSKLHFGDCVAVLNDLIYGYGGSIFISSNLDVYSVLALILIGCLQPHGTWQERPQTWVSI